MLAQVTNPNVRGTAVSLFFFFLTLFSIIMPAFYVGIRDYYGIEPVHEPHEFGLFITACTCIPSLLSIPAFYVSGVKYSWIRFKEMMFQDAIWQNMQEAQEEQISKKRLFKAYEQGGANLDDPTNLSVSIDYKLLRKERKLKHSELKGKIAKPSNVGRSGLLNFHKKVTRNLEGEDTLKSNMMS